MSTEAAMNTMLVLGIAGIVWVFARRIFNGN